MNKRSSEKKCACVCVFVRVNLALRRVCETGILEVIFWCKSDSAGEGQRKLHHHFYQIILGGDEKFIVSLLRIENRGHQEAYNEMI